jgi:hypothetical protein
MWTSAKQRKFNALRRRELDGTLTPAQQTQLSQLFDELNQEEQQQLAPHFQKLDLENEALAAKMALVKAQNARLAWVVSRQKVLVRRAKEQLRELRRERKKLLSEYARVMTGSFANQPTPTTTRKAA